MFNFATKKDLKELEQRQQERDYLQRAGWEQSDLQGSYWLPPKAKQKHFEKEGGWWTQKEALFIDRVLKKGK